MVAGRAQRHRTPQDLGADVMSGRTRLLARLIVPGALLATGVMGPVPSFASTAPAPTGVTPTALHTAAAGVAVHVAGSGFVTGATLTDPAGDITFAQESVTGDTDLDAVADVAATPSKLGLHDVVVHNPDGSTGSCVRCVTVGHEPAVPTGVHVAALDHGLGVSWSEPSAGTPFTFDVTWDDGAGSSGIVQVTSPATSVQIHALIPDVRYTVAVTPHNVFGDGSSASSVGRPGAVPESPSIGSVRLG